MLSALAKVNSHLILCTVAKSYTSLGLINQIELETFSTVLCLTNKRANETFLEIRCRLSALQV